MTGKPKKNLRHNARFHAVQAIYSWQLSGNDITEIYINLLPDINAKEVDMDLMRALFFGALEQRDAIDTILTPFLSRSLAEIDPVELAILRLATYELMQCQAVPYRVVINEGVELAKTLGATDGHKFVNGILDKVAQQVRQVEIAARNVAPPSV